MEKKELLEFQIDLLKCLNTVYDETQAFIRLQKVLKFLENYDRKSSLK